MTGSRCKDVWKAGRVVYMLLLHLSEPRVSHAAAAAGWDCLWIDLEHSPRTERELEVMCLAMRAGAADKHSTPPDVMARPGRGEFSRMGRLIEAGATGILYPRCESAAEAAEAVKACKFAPQGERGFDGGNADNRYGAYSAGDYVSRSNQRTWLAVQIESPAAVERVDEIARVPGVDLLFFGPGDYSCLTGTPGQLDGPHVREAMRKTGDACRRAGIGFGTLGLNPAQRQAALDAGARLIGVGADHGLLNRAMAQLLTDLTVIPPPGGAGR